MASQRIPRWVALVQALSSVVVTGAPSDEPPRLTAELVFPLHHQHNHAPSIVECSNGDLLVSWLPAEALRKFVREAAS